MHSNPTLDGAARSRPAAHGAAARGRRTVDAPTRMFHWLFALSFAGAWLTGDSERWRALHVTLGYTLAGLLVFRLAYGLFGPRQVALGALWRRVRGLPAWLRTLMPTVLPGPGAATGGVAWRQGQTLLVAVAIAALLLGALPLALSGYATWAEWGGDRAGEWLEEVHEFLANAMLAVVLVHVGLIAATSAWRRQNLARPMLTGRVAGSGPDLVTRNRAGLAAALLAAVLAFGAWQWQQFPAGLLPASGAQAQHASDDDDD